jgi:S1-C subfamily serine protease
MPIWQAGRRKTMPDDAQDLLVQFSAALSGHAAAARPLVARIAMRGHSLRSGTLWRQNVVVASEQALPDAEEAEIILSDGGTFAARVAGRDGGTNIAVLRFEGGPAMPPAPVELGAAQEPQPGALVLALGTDGASEAGGLSVRLGMIRSVGPSWHSRAGGLVDRRILLDVALGGREEGGPVVDMAGGLLGISTFGPRRRVLVIPAMTVARVLEPLLATGRVERGWLGAAVQPVLVPETLQSEAGQSLGLMVIGVTRDGPAAQAGVLAGDILLGVDSTSVGSPAQLARLLDEASVGSTVTLRLIRAGGLQSIAATVGSRPPR